MHQRECAKNLLDDFTGALLGLRSGRRMRPSLEYFIPEDGNGKVLGSSAGDAFPHFSGSLSYSQKKQLFRAIWESAEKLTTVDLEIPFREPDKGIRQNLQIRLHPARDQKGTVTWNGTLKLVKKATDATEEKRDIHRTVFDTSPNKIAVFDHQARIELINKNLEAFLGLSNQKAKGKTPSDLFQSNEIDKLEAAIINVSETGIQAVVEIPLTKPDGTSSIHVFKLMAEKSPDNEQNRVIVYGHDIDNLVRLRAEAAESQDQLHAAIRTLPDLFWVKDLEGRYTLCNDVFDEFNNVPKGWMLGKTAYETARPIELKAHLETDRRALESFDPVKFDVKIPSPDNDPAKTRYYAAQKIAIRNENGEVTGILGTARDVSESKRLEQELLRRERKYRQLLDNMPDFIIQHDESGATTFLNNAMKSLVENELGFTLSDFLSSALKEPDAHDTTRIVRQVAREALSAKSMVMREIEFLSVSGEILTHELRYIPEIGDDGSVTSLLGVGRDVTESRNLQEEVRRREHDYSQLLCMLPDCIIRHNAEGRITYVNNAMKSVIEDHFDLTVEQFQTIMMDETADRPEMTSYQALADRAIKESRTIQHELQFRSVNGEIYTHELRFIPEFDASGKVISLLSVGRDITDKKNSELKLQAKEKELERIAYTDSLTGLANRVKLQQTLRVHLDEAIRKNGQMALLTLDVDRFKSINDTMGHIVGDKLLVTFAERLNGVIGKKGWLGRMGGDEFVIILPNVNCRDEVLEIANEITGTINRPMQIDDNSITVSTSIGIAIGPEDSHCEETLFRFSDIALYKAKSSGRNQACSYSRSMSEEAENHFKLEAMINDGLKNDQFAAHFQAKINLSTRKITGAEALCRWRHPEDGPIAPDKFIPVAEETGQIVEIGKRILKQACEFAVTCNQISTEPFRVAVNVSPRQFVYGGFLGVLGQYLQESGCKAEWLELEITESLLLGDNAMIRETLQAIANLGVLISIDDFGTGYSALSYLRNLPIGGLKVDQSFVRDMNTDKKQGVLVRSVLAMAQGLKLKTVAEGVESEDIARELQSLGCETGQGYLWHRPAPPADILARLRIQTDTERTKNAAV